LSGLVWIVTEKQDDKVTSSYYHLIADASNEIGGRKAESLAGAIRRMTFLPPSPGALSVPDSYFGDWVEKKRLQWWTLSRL
jgi:hypothetical protein